MRRACRTAGWRGIGRGERTIESIRERGHGRITGRQKRSPAHKKHALSTSCQAWERIPSSNAAGRCHPITAAVAASQQNTGLQEESLEFVHYREADHEAHSAANPSPREPVHEWQSRRSEQNQGCPNRHDEEVLHHMSREQLMVESCERRTSSDPNRKQAADKSSNSPNRYRGWEGIPQAIPATDVDGGRDHESERNRNGKALHVHWTGVGIGHPSGAGARILPRAFQLPRRARRHVPVPVRLDAVFLKTLPRR